MVISGMEKPIEEVFVRFRKRKIEGIKFGGICPERHWMPDKKINLKTAELALYYSFSSRRGVNACANAG